MATQTIIDGGKQAITFNNDTEPLAIYVDGELQRNVSFVPQLAQGTGVVSYTSEYKKNLLNLQVSGNTTQKTYAGYNLLNKEEFTKEGLRNETTVQLLADTVLSNEVVNSIFKPNTTYTMSYEVEGLTEVPNGAIRTNSTTFILYSPTSAQFWISVGRIIKTGEILQVSHTFTTPENFYESNYTMRGYSGRFELDGVGTIVKCIFRNVQIVEGSTQKPYEPYVGGIPSPNPDYPQKIENANGEGMCVVLHGDNLYDISKIKGCANGSVTNPNTTHPKFGEISDNVMQLKWGLYADATFWTGVNIPITRGGKYYISCEFMCESTNTNYVRLNARLCNFTKKKWSALLMIADDNVRDVWQTKTFNGVTIPDSWIGDEVYLSLQVLGTSAQYSNIPAYAKNIMISYGEPKPYEPYFREEITIPTSVDITNTDGTTTTVQLPFSIYDKLTVDRVANEVIYHQGAGYRELRGTETFGTFTTNGEITRFTIAPSRLGFKRLSGDGYCSHFIVGETIYLGNDPEDWSVGANKLITFVYDANSVEAFKSWLAAQYAAGTPVTILAEYTEVNPIDITNTTLGQSLLNLATQNQTNYIEVTGNTNAPEIPIKLTYAKWGELVENNGNT